VSLLHIIFWVADLVWLLALLFSYAAPVGGMPRTAGWPLVGAWIPYVCVTILGFLVLGLHVG